jgi:hypothetical protein
MSHYRVGCDAHRRYSQFPILNEAGQLHHQARVDHEQGAIQAFLESLPQGTPVALESVGNGHTPAISGLVLDRRRARPGPMGQGSKLPVACLS